MADVEHLAFPLRLADSGRLATVEEDSLNEVAQGVYFVAGVEPGTVADLRGTGVPAVAYLRNGVDTDRIASLLEKQEPRAIVAAVRRVDTRTDGVDAVEIDVALASEAEAEAA